MKPTALKATAGFTLLELAILLTLVGILVVMVVPAFFDSTAEANQTETDGIAQALTAASAKNYTLFVVGSTEDAPVANCTDVAALMSPSNPLPAGFVISSQAVTPHENVTCTVTHSDGVTTATFVVTGTS